MHSNNEINLHVNLPQTYQENVRTLFPVDHFKPLSKKTEKVLEVLNKTLEDSSLIVTKCQDLAKRATYLGSLQKLFNAGKIDLGSKDLAWKNAKVVGAWIGLGLSLGLLFTAAAIGGVALAVFAVPSIFIVGGPIGIPVAQSYLFIAIGSLLNFAMASPILIGLTVLVAAYCQKLNAEFDKRPSLAQFKEALNEFKQNSLSENDSKELLKIEKSLEETIKKYVELEKEEQKKLNFNSNYSTEKEELQQALDDIKRLHEALENGCSDFIAPLKSSPRVSS